MSLKYIDTAMIAKMMLKKWKSTIIRGINQTGKVRLSGDSPLLPFRFTLPRPGERTVGVLRENLGVLPYQEFPLETSDGSGKRMVARTLHIIERF